jgi:CRISPR-associated endonuclease Csn1
LAESWVNKAKGNMTAFTFMQSQAVPGLQSFDHYVAMVNDLKEKKAIGSKKFEYLMCPNEKIPTDFIDRQLRQTQYITRKAMQLLRLVCRDVHATSGGVTDFLREKWGWNDVLKKLNWDRYERMGKTSVIQGKSGQKIYQIEGWSKRDDHRHHAVDALVIACTKPAYIQALNNLSQLLEEEDQNKSTQLKKMNHFKLSQIEQAKPFDTSVVMHHTDQIVVSFKSGKRVASKSKNKSTSHVQWIPRGPLSEETVYGKIKQRVHVSVALNKSYNPEWLVVDPQVRKLIQERLAAHGNDPAKAFKKPLYWDNTETNPIKKVNVWDWQEEVVVKYAVSSLKGKDIPYIVDDAAKARVQEYFDRCGNDKEFQKRVGTEPIWFNEAAGIAIKTVRLKTGLGKVTSVKEVPLEEATAFVKAGNNHHLAVYERADGSLFDHMVSFQEAFAAKRAGLSVYQTHREDGQLKWRFEQNAIFELNDPVKGRGYYRVQKISKKATGAITMFFRSINSTNVSDGLDLQEVGFYYEAASLLRIASLKPSPIRTNCLGEILD